MTYDRPGTRLPCVQDSRFDWALRCQRSTGNPISKTMTGLLLEPDLNLRDSFVMRGHVFELLVCCPTIRRRVTTQINIDKPSVADLVSKGCMQNSTRRVDKESCGRCFRCSWVS